MGNFIILCNIKIYLQKNINFKSKGDTEVLLKLYETHGINF